MAPSPVEQQIAEWMLSELRRHGELLQAHAAAEIISRYGDAHVYYNNNGNPALNKGILEAFRKLTGDDVVWSRSEQLWRSRETDDPPGKRMVD